jgi:hypothetical protein
MKIFRKFFMTLAPEMRISLGSHIRYFLWKQSLPKGYEYSYTALVSVAENRIIIQHSALGIVSNSRT